MKQTARGLARLFILPLQGVYLLMMAIVQDQRLFGTMSEMLSLIPGLAGVYIRREFYRLNCSLIENDVHIGFGTVLSQRDVELSSNVYIGRYCSLGLVSVGTGAYIGSNVDIMSGKHQHVLTEAGDLTDSEHGDFTRVHIGKGSWLGNSCVVMADVGEGTIIGAGSVVVKPIPRKSIAVGNPARIIRDFSASS